MTIFCYEYTKRIREIRIKAVASEVASKKIMSNFSFGNCKKAE